MSFVASCWNQNLGSTRPKISFLKYGYGPDPWFLYGYPLSGIGNKNKLNFEHAVLTQIKLLSGPCLDNFGASRWFLQNSTIQSFKSSPSLGLFRTNEVLLQPSQKLHLWTAIHLLHLYNTMLQVAGTIHATPNFLTHPAIWPSACFALDRWWKIQHTTCSASQARVLKSSTAAKRLWHFQAHSQLNRPDEVSGRKETKKSFTRTASR